MSAVTQLLSGGQKTVLYFQLLIKLKFCSAVSFLLIPTLSQSAGYLRESNTLTKALTPCYSLTCIMSPSGSHQSEDMRPMYYLLQCPDCVCYCSWDFPVGHSVALFVWLNLSQIKSGGTRLHYLKPSSVGSVGWLSGRGGGSPLTLGLGQAAHLLGSQSRQNHNVCDEVKASWFHVLSFLTGNYPQDTVLKSFYCICVRTCVMLCIVQLYAVSQLPSRP